MIPRTALVAFFLAVMPALAAAQALDGRLKRIKDTKSITIAHRTDAMPFSFVDDAKRPVGYTVDLCKRVVAAMEQSLGVQGIQVKWVPVTSQSRFDAIAKGQADMECGSSSVTLGRLKQVDFSNYTFVDGTGLLARAENKLATLADLSGKKIGVVGGTTNEAAVQRALKERLVNATVVPLKTRDEGLAKLEAREIDAFAGDNVLLFALGLSSKDPKALRMLDDTLSFEPYAITLPRGDSAFRIEVNSALARIYRSEAIEQIYGTWFGALGKPGPALRAVYGMGAIPD